MANWYFKITTGSADNSFIDVNNWWSNQNGTGSHPVAYPWSTSATIGDSLYFATGYSTVPRFANSSYGYTIGAGGVVTGTCYTGVVIFSLVTPPQGEDPEYYNPTFINSGIFSGAVTLGEYADYNSTINGGTFNNSIPANIYVAGGTFNVAVSLNTSIAGSPVFNAAVTGTAQIQSGTFNGSVSCNSVGDSSNVSTAVFNNTLSVSYNIYTSSTFSQTVNCGSAISGTGIFNGAVYCKGINGGTFNSIVNNSTSTVTGGTFNGSFTQTSGNITGGTFNSSFTQTAGNVSGGTFNGTYTRVTGNVTGGTFNNGIINQFYRNGWPPPLVFPGYNTKALDVLGTGLV